MYKISQTELNNVLKYLSSRPYNEVAPMVQTLIRLEQIVEAPVVNKKPGKVTKTKNK